MDLSARLSRLARITRTTAPVVSVYLDTRWTDQHQRDRVRVFLRREIKRAREAWSGQAIGAALDWIEAQGEALVQQAQLPNAHGVALFACEAPEIREILPLRTPFEDAFVVTDMPYLGPLAAVADETPSTLVVFVDGESARLIPLAPEGARDEVVLESEVPGHHRRGGWAQLAQSRYQRHIEDHRGRHFEAVADALVQLTEGNGVRHVVLSGDAGTLAAFRKHVPAPIAERIVGSVTGARHEAAAALLDRAGEVVAQRERQEARAAVDLVLTEAAKGGRAVAGLEETLEAVSRGAVRRLFVLKGFREAGRACGGCGALHGGAEGPCRLCGQATAAIDLGAAMTARTLAGGGAVTTLEDHGGLAHVGRVAALLRYPL